MKVELIMMKVQNMKDYINMLLGEIDAGPLGNNPLSEAMIDTMLSQMVREVAVRVTDKKISGKLYSTGKSMMETSASALVAGWEDGDDICPPYRHFVPRSLWGPYPIPVPHPNPGPYFTSLLDEVSLNPQPLPPGPPENMFTDFGSSAREIMMAETLRVIASLTSNHEFNKELKTTATHLMKSAASGRVSEEFEEKCGSTGPRKPFPPRRGTQAGYFHAETGSIS